MCESTKATLLWIATELLKEAESERKTPFQIVNTWIARRLFLHRLNQMVPVTEMMVHEATPLAKAIAKRMLINFGGPENGALVRLQPTNWEAGQGRLQFEKMVQVQLARNRW